VAQVGITKQKHKTKIANLKEGKNMGVIFDDEFKWEVKQSLVFNYKFPKMKPKVSKFPKINLPKT
jgi:hypothetical protein